MGGGRSKNFTEGWVEFEDKAEAKHVSVLEGFGLGVGQRYHMFCVLARWLCQCHFSIMQCKACTDGC